MEVAGAVLGLALVLRFVMLIEHLLVELMARFQIGELHRDIRGEWWRFSIFHDFMGDCAGLFPAVTGSLFLGRIPWDFFSVTNLGGEWLGDDLDGAADACGPVLGH